ncbi:PPP family 3-phenylpropionic acid transporter [Peribacillus deserti]|uniref:PPP family 3-phenylpropionic acid transporter n=1 Tax=Peribacillus deserti TaxID=673318 RepID=A0ABS2QMI7_9BACI|nr:MFS transporter [Peribacillus deserti]MBM7693461.1 PPP family 3-phenylpropionic acid transporter [Peribacillus deserti]
MNKQVLKETRILQSFYLFTFFGVGSMAPLLSVFLSKERHLDGFEVGTIMSVGPIVMIFFQPFWGILTDKIQAPRKILALTAILTGIMGLGFLLGAQFAVLLTAAVLVAIFQSALIPISDSISLQFTSRVKGNYGNIRLFGSLGFGLAVFIIGKLSDMYIGLEMIFYSFFISMAISSILSFYLPKEKAGSKVNILSGVKEIFAMKKFIVFLAITFLIFGPNLANNTYFGLFVEARGGTYAGIGLAFLVAVLSEIPFMRAAGAWIKSIGLLPITLIAGVSSLIRWSFYFTEPNLTVIYASAVIQGLSIGLFLPAALQYIRDIAPMHIAVTAVTIYSAIGNGLGNWFHTFVGGIILDQFKIQGVYLFFSIMALIGVVLNIYLMRLEKSTSSQTILSRT